MERIQLADESVEQFNTNLYQLVEHCEYGDLRDEMVRDHIIVGIRDSALSERLQMDPVLTLEKAKKLVCQREAVHEHQQFLTGKTSASEEATLEAVSKNSGAKQVNKRLTRGPIQPPSRVPQQRRHQQVCSRCGKGAHSRQACPAKDSLPATSVTKKDMLHVPHKIHF